MKHAWRSFLGPLTLGVRVMLLVLTAIYLTAVAGVFTKAYNLYSWLALSGAAFWSGKIWTILTYAVLPATLVDFLFNWLLILFLGSYLERVWTHQQLWIFCGVAALGGGLAKVILQPFSPVILVGTSPIVFGLLAAWGLLFRHERILFWFMWEMSVRQAAILLTVISFLLMLPCAGLINDLIMLSGGLAGWLYVRAATAVTLSRSSRTIVSERMGRLEL
jgi:membrane associated rhomboid family serine protease